VRKAGDNFVEDIDRGIRTKVRKRAGIFFSRTFTISARLRHSSQSVGICLCRMLGPLGFEALSTTIGATLSRWVAAVTTQVGREMVARSHFCAGSGHRTWPISLISRNAFGYAPEDAAETSACRCRRRSCCGVD